MLYIKKTLLIINYNIYKMNSHFKSVDTQIGNSISPMITDFLFFSKKSMGDKSVPISHTAKKVKNNHHKYDYL